MRTSDQSPDQTEFDDRASAGTRASPLAPGPAAPGSSAPGLSATGSSAPRPSAPLPRSGAGPLGQPPARLAAAPLAGARTALSPAASSVPLDPSAAAAPGLDVFLAGSAPPPAVAGGAAASPDALLVPREPANEGEIFLVAAEAIFILVAQLRAARAEADATALRFRVGQELKRFEDAALRFGGRAEDIAAARYVLCALVDESVLTTPWGSRSGWSASSLLSELHGETWGGEKVFQILERAMTNPGRYIALLRHIDLALLLGFEGRYRVIDNGRYQLEDLRAEIGRVIKANLPPVPDELSGQWRGVASRNRLRRYVPGWVVAMIGAAVLAVLYSVLQFGLVQATEPVQRRLEELARPVN